MNYEERMAAEERDRLERNEAIFKRMSTKMKKPTPPDTTEKIKALVGCLSNRLKYMENGLSTIFSVRKADVIQLATIRTDIDKCRNELVEIAKLVGVAK